MKPYFVWIISAIFLFNAALLIASYFLSQRSMQHYPAIGQLICVDGVTMHVVDTGTPELVENNDQQTDVPVVVLIHGASTSLLDFEKGIKQHLAQNMRIISIDRPGHGYSERGNADAPALSASSSTASAANEEIALLDTPDPWTNPQRQARLIAGALEALGAENSIWVGHSWAGSVVMAGLLKENVRAGVLLAGATHPWEGGSAWHVELAATPIIGPLFSWQYIEPIGNLALEGAIASVFAPEAVPDNYLEEMGVVLSLRPQTFQHNAQDLTRLSGYLEQQSLEYGSIRQPILSITGSKDTIVPAWNHDARLALQVPQLQSVELEGAGHALHHSRSREVEQLIEAFVQSLPDSVGLSR
ncbi:alpha/beta fold hydrolase [Granulosicoccus antarcticus]|uniref:2-succinyl-6-hydroxy-2, 4-cyclohexadiene-1-carboxylate synthase n=1 Tax=Granulosicoccus antarcticus IMCC3135 TaxID=1192854 RepID=A0A2Z2NT33_9GAMM|nr:alpha/beta hydrolase [Granulosicoccus antarcticus]ASJ73685.1 2-succinyl-6-hydroxy-2,4-cyclohexadiene-1-carboxylate synthase [Granulosicoccus antarcticus IMCC3135]